VKGFAEKIRFEPGFSLKYQRWRADIAWSLPIRAFTQPYSAESSSA